ncbi:glycosyltransferase family 2 protein [Terriglobus albidus]|uniref:Glycosyltransferase family 2 protein n=1 Tax=Terriglobus albidus TaxID=1592106 RepID=A0A5B9EES6_9BACT|nr:glycosyltransferase [Terriglobus albidus]QEE29310.1 glycosyltransferase family 2 protein [Terriglobus albidus]
MSLVNAEKCDGEQVGIDRTQIAVIIPTCNAEKNWDRLIFGLHLQKLLPHQITIVDSSSEDRTCELALREGFQLIRIDRANFNHGGTRQMALHHVHWASLVVYMTQDAVLANEEAIDQLIAPFLDPKIGLSYGRQLPRPGAGPFEAHARLFNYPGVSQVRTFESRRQFGIKAAFSSNSFAAYRVEALQSVGGFPSDVIIAEDSVVAAKMLMSGWKTVYQADAQVYHSHSYSPIEEFRRYFDIGVCHHRESWMRETFGKADGEGLRFLRSEISYLWPNRFYLLPEVFVRSTAKILGYKLGLMEEKLPSSLSRKLSFFPDFWKDPVRSKSSMRRHASS